MVSEQVSLAWSDTVLDLQDLLADLDTPVYIVGGAVRDAYLRRPIQDVDMVTPGSGRSLARQIANRLKGDYYTLDEERDVGRALVNTPDGKVVFDVARFRGDDLTADLTDRDFTINAIAVDLKGDLNALIDPLDGLTDLREKRLRRCSPQAIPNDPIRALRAVRQSTQFGFRIEAETLRDARAAAPSLNDVSPERARDEFFKLLSLARPAAALRVADTLGLLEVLVPEVKALHGLAQGENHVYDAWNHTLAVIDHLHDIWMTISPYRTDETAAQFSLGMMVMALDRYRSRLQDHLTTPWSGDRTHRALLMLAALLHDIGKPLIPPPTEPGVRRFAGHAKVGAEMAEARAVALRLSNAETERITVIVREHMLKMLWEEEPTPVNMHRFWRRAGAAGVDVILLALADYQGTVAMKLDQDTWLRIVERARLLLHAYYEQYNQIVEPPALVNGNTLQTEFNLKPGPIIRELLDLIREAQVDGRVLTADDALQLARTYLDERAQPNV